MTGNKEGGTQKQAKFQIPVKPTTQKRLSPEEVENFAQQAKTTTAQPPAANTSKCLLLRLNQSQFARFEEVFSKSHYKSKQKMGEELLMEAIEEFAKKTEK